MNAWDEFRAKYVQPRVESVIVGFSGLDPDENGGNLTDEQLRDLISSYLSNLTIRIDSGNIDPDAVEPEVPYITLKPSEIPHEMLDGLLGGNEEGHYHLTEEELEKLGKLINALIPAGQTNVTLPSGGTSDHEALSNLQGGTVSSDGTVTEHFHFKEDEWIKLRKVLEALFPPGSVTPVFPSGPVSPSPSGDEDDESGEGGEGGDEGYDEDLSTDAGLSPNTPPAWQSVSLPSKYFFYEGAGNMYYGTIVVGSTPYIREALVMPMVNDTSRTVTVETINAKTTIYINSTEDLSAWKAVDGSVSKSDYGKTLADCLYYDYNETPLDSNSNRKFYYVTYKSTKANVQRRSTGGTGNQTLASAQSLVAACLSGDRDVAIFVTEDGIVSRLKRNKTIAKTGSKKGQVTSVSVSNESATGSCNVGTVNFGCAIWIPAYNCFCVSGTKGVAISGTGQTWSKKAADGVNVPANLKGLTYRSDIQYVDKNGTTYTGCAFGWSADDKTFWKSYDGEHWARHNSTPIPLKEVKAVAYSPETGIYCAVGTPKAAEDGLYVYMSKNLAGWFKVKVSVDDLTAESVIWMANTGKFVLTPTSGSYFYTFKATDWK